MIAAICLARYGGTGIPHLMVLGCTGTFEFVIVRKRLKPRGLSHCQTAALPRIVMNEVMTVLAKYAM